MKTLDELEADLTAATPGEWHLRNNEVHGEPEYHAESFVCCFDDIGVELTEQDYCNAQLITRMKNNLPALIECAKALRAMVSTYRTFRNVPVENQGWTSVDEEVLDAGFAALDKLEK